MTNVYDAAYMLERALRESDDFKRLKGFYDSVNRDSSSKQLFDNFRETQFLLGQKQMMGEPITDAEVQSAEQQFAYMQQHPLLSKLLEAEGRLTMLMNDVTKIVMKPLDDLYGIPEQYK